MLHIASPLYLAVDVGTGSVRAGLFTEHGQRVGYGEHPILRRDGKPQHIEQSSDDIWYSVCTSVRIACASSMLSDAAARVAAIGIDATCSLVAVDRRTSQPLSVVEGSVADARDADGISWNVMLWLDHRAEREAELINGLSGTPAVADVLRRLGGQISLENEPPKLLWLQRHLPGVVARARFFDLADWLVFCCTAAASRRSACTVACKWGWGATSGAGWNPDFWRAIGLGALVEGNFELIGRDVLAPGAPAGTLSEEAARALGLSRTCVVATPLIDAHCGAVGMLGARGDARTDGFALEQRLAMVCGTSTCHLALSRAPVHVGGVWGPFRDAVVGGRWCSEAGQSVSGELLRHLVEGHAAYGALVARVGAGHVFAALDSAGRAALERSGADPATHVHVLDGFCGNRSPFADPSFRGVVTGLELGGGGRELVALYRAAVQALCYGARLIIERLNEHGHDIGVIFACGGLTKSAGFLQELADACALRVVVTAETESVLLGGAVIAACALAGARGGTPVQLETHMRQMSSVGRVFEPDPRRADYHRRKYAVYLEMHDDFKKYQRIMFE